MQAIAEGHRIGSADRRPADPPTGNRHAGQDAGSSLLSSAGLLSQQETRTPCRPDHFAVRWMQTEAINRVKPYPASMFARLMHDNPAFLTTS